MRLWLVVVLGTLLAAQHPAHATFATTAVAAAAGAAPSASVRPLALIHIDPLGLDAEIVARLEALLRAELERIVGAGLPTAREVSKLVDGDPKLANCTGEPDCLAAIGRALRAQLIVVGNVG